MPTKPNLDLMPVDTGSVHERVYAELRRALMMGALTPDETFTIRSLASAVGTSVMPVREALKRLVAQNALEVLPNRRVSLPYMTQGRFDEITLLRQMIEGAMGEAAARAPDDVRQPLLAVLADLDARMREARSDGMARYLELNLEFHHTIYRAARMPLALDMVEGLWMQVGPLLNLMAGAPAPDNHPAVIAAFSAGNGEALRQALGKDIGQTAAVLRQRLGMRPLADARPGA